MKNKIALFFFAIIISTTSLSISKEYVKSLKDETNNKIPKQILDGKKSEIKKEGNGWSSWSTSEKVFAVVFAATCVTVVIIGGIVLKIEYDIRNHKTPPDSNPFGQSIAEQNNHLDTLDKIIEKLDPPTTG